MLQRAWRSTFLYFVANKVHVQTTIEYLIIGKENFVEKLVLEKADLRAR